MPITIRDPGLDGVLGNADDGAGIPGFNLSAAAIAAGVRNLVTNLPGDARVPHAGVLGQQAAVRPLVAAGFVCDAVERGPGDRLLRQQPPLADDAVNPERSDQHRERGRYKFTMWTAKVNGSYDAPWGIRLTPALRVQQGQPYGRTFLAGAANGINYGSQRILAEPIDSQRQDNIVILDIRTEKSFSSGAARIGLFCDIYNMTNSNAAQNIGWNSGIIVSASGLDHRTAHHALRHEVRLVVPFANGSRHDADSQRRGRRALPARR